MGVGKVLGRDAVLRSQAVQVWHRGAANNLGVAVVLFNDQEDVAERGLAGRNRRLNGRAESMAPTGDLESPKCAESCERHKQFLNLFEG